MRTSRATNAQKKSGCWRGLTKNDRSVSAHETASLGAGGVAGLAVAQRERERDAAHEEDDGEDEEADRDRRHELRGDDHPDQTADEDPQRPESREQPASGDGGPVRHDGADRPTDHAVERRDQHRGYEDQDHRAHGGEAEDGQRQADDPGEDPRHATPETGPRTVREHSPERLGDDRRHGGDGTDEAEDRDLVVGLEPGDEVGHERVGGAAVRDVHEQLHAEEAGHDAAEPLGPGGHRGCEIGHRRPFQAWRSVAAGSLSRVLTASNTMVERSISSYAGHPGSPSRA